MGRTIGQKLRERVGSLRSQLRRYPGELVRALRDAPSLPDAPTDVRAAHPLAAPSPGLASSWLGHATGLLRIGGTTILTDPVLGRRIGPRVIGRSMGPARLQRAPIDPHALRGVDLIILSHAHFDHLDLPSLEALVDARTTVITACGTKRLVPTGFRRVIELPWDRTLRTNGLAITALRAEHWGARHGVDRWRRHNAYLVDGAHGRVLFAGDTAATDAFDRLRSVDLAMLGIGAYEGWRHRHATPEEAWVMFRRMGGRAMMATHHATFDMGEPTPHEPMLRLLAAAGDRAESIVCRSPGERWTPSESAA